MANKQNLIPQAHTLTVEEQSKGGKISGQVRKEKKTIQKILNDFLDSGINTNQKLTKLAEKAGLSTEGSIKDLVTAVCILNTLKQGDVSELQKLTALLGEENQNSDVIDKLDQVLKGIDEVMHDD
jgi:hypothetical protein